MKLAIPILFIFTSQFSCFCLGQCNKFNVDTFLFNLNNRNIPEFSIVTAHNFSDSNIFHRTSTVLVFIDTSYYCLKNDSNKIKICKELLNKLSNDTISDWAANIFLYYILEDSPPYRLMHKYASLQAWRISGAKFEEYQHWCSYFNKRGLNRE